MTIPSYWQPDFQPVAAPAAVVTAPQVRFTVLTPRLLRLEYDPNGRFQDRPSQVFWYRQQPIPPFELIRRDDTLEIVTEQLHLRYRTDAAGFTPDALSITLTGSGVTWRYGMADEQNLKGTTRTLDRINGRTDLQPGLLSRSGWTAVDDNHTLIFNEDGWPTPRDAHPDAKDLYFFGYGKNYKQALQDFALVAGPTPLLPRWALGNWWSRYWPYSQDEIIQLMGDFRRHDIPLSICILDMDWHVTDVEYDPADLTWVRPGWTGYTWNQDLFPDPESLLAWFHKQGLKTALNLHPADGVWPHEAMYPDMAERLGIDPESRRRLPFDIADPDFAQAYFAVLHHPEEERGVDFWWIDWQQGEESNVPGLDPLWQLNHLHFYDLGRKETQRPFIFSRWGGLGNHRYPIGFSGDTHITWESLAFQPYFTAAAANVGYGWWSHDIGGHMQGLEEPELYVRWLQFGAFSPILRLHSSNNPFHERRPWAFDDTAFYAARQALQLRHALIPYLYTMSWRNAQLHEPPVRPLYHDYPNHEAAYACPHQYTFGSELIAAPFTAPADPDTNLSRQVVWLPPGDWIHFFTGEYFPGDRWHVVYGRLTDIPVFAKAGGIVPLGPETGWGGVENPTDLHLHLFAGADGAFTLYEDDGETQAYRQGADAVMTFTLAWEPQTLTLAATAVTGDRSLVPDERQIHLHIHGVIYPGEAKLQVAGETRPCAMTYNAAAETLQINNITVPAAAPFRLELSTVQPTLLSRRDRTVHTCREMLRLFRLETMTKQALLPLLETLTMDPSPLARYAPALRPSQMRALLEVTQQAGMHYLPVEGEEPLLLLWNNRGETAVSYRFNQHDADKWQPEERFQLEQGPVPRFRALSVADEWQAVINYADLTQFRYHRTDDEIKYGIASSV